VRVDDSPPIRGLPDPNISNRDRRKRSRRPEVDRRREGEPVRLYRLLSSDLKVDLFRGRVTD
jgi:hypothetical protein